MKKNVMVIAAMMISTIIFAQGNRKGSFRPQPPHAAVSNELGISEAQRTSMESVNRKYAAKQAEALKTLREQKDKEITALLTPEQKAKREQMRKEDLEKRAQFQAKMAKEHDARMKLSLLLSDEQAAKLHNEDVAYRKKLEVIRKDQAARGMNQDELKKIKTEHETAVQNILNTEQFKKWNSLNSAAPGRNPRVGANRNQFDRQRAFGGQPHPLRKDSRDQGLHRGRGHDRDQRGPARNDNREFLRRG